MPQPSIKEVPLDDLYWNNNSGMALFKTQENLEKYVEELKEDILKSGIKKPPVIRKTTLKDILEVRERKYRVLQGNHRTEVAKQLGWKEIKCEVRNAR